MSILNGRKTLLLLTCALMLLSLMGGCNKNENPSGLSGTVVVTDGSAGGVEVMVFEAPANIPASGSVWGEHERHPTVGFAFSAQAAFDWRLEQSSMQATTTTGSDGKFNFPSLSNGDYLIVARKEGYGWTAPKPVSLQGSNLDAGTLTLYSEATIPDGSSITENTHWLAGHHYIVENRVFVETGATLTVDPGAVVRFGQNGFLLVFGRLVSEGTPDAFIHYTSNILINPNSGDWTSVNFLEGAEPPKFRYCTFDYSYYGILGSERGGVVENCYFSFVVADGIDLNGTHAVSGDSLFIQYNVIDHVQVGIRAVYVVSPTPCIIAHNLLVNCPIWGLEYSHNQGCQIYCNYFNYSGRVDSVGNTNTGAVSISESKEIEISNNLFYNSWRSIWVGSYVDSSVIIHNNFLRDNPRRSTAIYIGLTDSHRGPSFPNVYNNCFVRDYYTIKVDAGLINTHSILARNNYWGTTSDQSIRDGIIDRDDDPSLPFVLYDPWLDDCPADASLCTE